MLQQVRDTLVAERVPRVHAETAVKQNPGLGSILDELVMPAAADLPAADRERLEGAMAATREAVTTHQAWLENELLPNAIHVP